MCTLHLQHVESRIVGGPVYLRNGNAHPLFALYFSPGTDDVPIVSLLPEVCLRALPSFGRHLDRLTRAFPDDRDGHRFFAVCLDQFDEFGLVAHGLPVHGQQDIVDLEPRLGRGSVVDNLGRDEPMAGRDLELGSQGRLDGRGGNANPEGPEVRAARARG